MGDEIDKEKQVRESRPLLPDTPAARVTAGGFATAILGSLGYIASSVLDVGRELQQAIDQGNHYKSVIENQISTLTTNQENLRERIRTVEQEQVARREVIERARREQDYLERRARPDFDQGSN